MNHQIDILDIHNRIIENFENEYKNIEKYKNTISEINQTILSETLTSAKKLELEKIIAETEVKIKKIENKEDLNFYLIESAEIIEEYREKLKKPIKLFFCGKIKDTKSNNNSNLVKKYLEIAQKYFNIYLKSEEKFFSICCDVCGNKKDFATEENAYICVNCGSQQELIQHITSYKDSDRVNISTKYTYDRKVHFRDCINQYQGKQNCSIDQKVYNQLEDIFEKHHLLCGDKISKREIRFSKITKEHVLMFLKELSLPKHYENVTLIHYNITGKKPDDISYLEDKLLLDFDILVETYDKFFKNRVDRVNFISTQYVLYQLLQRHKHPCKKEDFVILKTMDRKWFHDSVCRELFDLLGWNFTPIY